MPYDYQPFEYTAPPGLTAPEPRHKVVIVGAGPIGVAMALELANHGIPSVVLDDNNVVSVGSRAICWAKRTLEIFDRLGVGERMLEKGVTWKVGRNFFGDQEVYSFDLLPAGRSVRVRGLQRHGQTVDSVACGDRAAINLPGLKQDEVVRGDVLATFGYFHPTQMLDVRLRLLQSSPRGGRSAPGATIQLPRSGH